jgi:hypothetical protein
VPRSRARAAGPVRVSGALLRAIHTYHVLCVCGTAAAAATPRFGAASLEAAPPSCRAPFLTLSGVTLGSRFVTHWGDRRLSRVASGTAPPVTHQSVTVSPRVNSSALTREGRISALAEIYAC